MLSKKILIHKINDIENALKNNEYSKLQEILTSTKGYINFQKEHEVNRLIIGEIKNLMRDAYHLGEKRVSLKEFNAFLKDKKTFEDVQKHG